MQSKDTHLVFLNHQLARAYVCPFIDWHPIQGGLCHVTYAAYGLGWIPSCDMIQ